jgi:hypothetical protein
VGAYPLPDDVVFLGALKLEQAQLGLNPVNSVLALRIKPSHMRMYFPPRAYQRL